MSTGPLVSVIIPAHNAARFIRATLDSVLSQTHRTLEVLVVDDGSTDDTRRIVEEAVTRDNRVRLITQSNQGVAAARNAAAASAAGEYLAPIDADDTWLPTKIEEQVRCFAARGPACGLCYTWWLGLDEQGTVGLRSYPWRVEGRVAAAHTALNFIGNASVPLIRTATFHAVGGYDESFHAAGAQGCEDWDLSLRVSEQYEVGVVPQHLTAYRRVSGSMSGQLATMVRSHELMMARLRERRPDVPEQLVRWSRGQVYGYAATVAARTGAPGAAIRWLVAGMLSPSVSYSSPWIVELMAAKLPPSVARPLLPLIRGRMARWT